MPLVQVAYVRAQIRVCVCVYRCIICICVHAHVHICMCAVFVNVRAWVMSELINFFFFTAGNVPPAGILYSKTAPGRVSGT